jgi:hypothetical protein
VLDLPWAVMEAGVSRLADATRSTTVRPLQGSTNFGVGAGTGHFTGSRSQRTFQRIRVSSPDMATGALQPINIKLPNLEQFGTIAELVYSALRR